MAGFTQATQQQVLDYLFPTTAATNRYVAYSENGSTESANLARTDLTATGWSAATAATPSVKSNANTVQSAAASGAATITHFAVFDAASAGNQKTDWQALSTSRTLASGDKVEWAAGALDITLD